MTWTISGDAWTLGLAALSAVLLITVIGLYWKIGQLRRSRRKLRNGWPWPVPTVQMPLVDPVFEPGEFGPTLDTEVRMLGRGSISVPGGTSDSEAWVIAVLAKRYASLFEFGTCTGKTSYLWARNTGPAGRVTTLTLPPDGHAAYQRAAGDDADSTRWALEESAYQRFVYTGTDVADRITQLYGDSKTFDETPYADQFDVVFVDGSHAYSYVLSDSRKAMAMVKPGGLVLWHDYEGPFHAPDVYRGLNELRAEVPLQHIAGTTMVFWRRPLL